MDVLVYPSTHPQAASVSQSVASLLTPNYLPQVLSPNALAAADHPWHSACALLILLSSPEDPAAVRKYLNFGGKILALGVSAKKTNSLFSLSDSLSPLGLGIARDTSVLRLNDGNVPISLSFPSEKHISATVVDNRTEHAVLRSPSAILDFQTAESRVLGRYADRTLAGVLSQNALIALWSCAPPLSEFLLAPTLAALGLQFDSPTSTDGHHHNSPILPQLLLAHPDNWGIQKLVVRSLFSTQDLQKAFSSPSFENVGHPEATQVEATSVPEGAIFYDENDNFRFHLTPKFLSSAIERPASMVDHPLSTFIESETELDDDTGKTKHIVLPVQPFTVEQEKLYTPLFSPSVFFRALDELRKHNNSNIQRDIHAPWRMGDALLYGEVVTSTQTMFDKNPKFLRALPSPLLSFATKQVAGRGRGANAWLSPAGCMQMTLKLRVAVKTPSSSTNPVPSIRTSDLVFIQYLFAIAVVEACYMLDPTRKWTDKVRLKWPNDIYGEFPSEVEWKSNEAKKLGGIIVNTSFGGGLADVIIGCGLNVFNDPPIASLAQLEALAHDGKKSSNLSVERVAAAVLTRFESIWDEFIAQEDRNFEPFMDRYTSKWLHTNQIITLTTTTPHTMVRIEGITPDHGLLRTVPLSLGGGRFIDLLPDGNSFDMMKGLIKAKS
ncbi:class II aaRS and biotin synthetase [Phlebopus sp. FC_14]|nr:class II aaRS and biotin synthetase [Phlebopus sp. FC_14]